MAPIAPHAARPAARARPRGLRLVRVSPQQAAEHDRAFHAELARRRPISKAMEMILGAHERRPRVITSVRETLEAMPRSLEDIKASATAHERELRTLETRRNEIPPKLAAIKDVWKREEAGFETRKRSVKRVEVAQHETALQRYGETLKMRVHAKKASINYGDPFRELYDGVLRTNQVTSESLSSTAALKTLKLLIKQNRAYVPPSPGSELWRKIEATRERLKGDTTTPVTMRDALLVSCDALQGRLTKGVNKLLAEHGWTPLRGKLPLVFVANGARLSIQKIDTGKANTLDTVVAIETREERAKKRHETSVHKSMLRVITKQHNAGKGDARRAYEAKKHGLESELSAIKRRTREINQRLGHLTSYSQVIERQGLRRDGRFTPKEMVTLFREVHEKSA